MTNVNALLFPNQVVQSSPKNVSSYTSGNDPNIATDLPKYGIFGAWACSDWITWHKTLKHEFGKDEADKRWMDAWNKQGFWDTPQSWCKYIVDFNNYVRAEKLPVSWVLPDIIVGAQNVAENAVTTATNITDVLKYAIPVLLATAAGGIVYFGYKYFNKKVS